MASAIESYMAERTTAFQFDDALSKIIESTQDKTVSEVGTSLWFFYDDVKDHKIVASKEVWDYFSRLLLLLRSNSEVDVVRKRRRWTIRQIIAALALVAFAIVTIKVGWGLHLLVFSMPFGVISMLLTFWSNCEKREKYKGKSVLTPFPSVASVLAIRRRTPAFSKQRYPQIIRGRQVRGPIMDKLLWIPCGSMWLIFAPVPLFFQMFPETDVDICLKPQSAASG